MPAFYKIENIFSIKNFVIWVLFIQLMLFLNSENVSHAYDDMIKMYPTISAIE